MLGMLMKGVVSSHTQPPPLMVWSSFHQYEHNHGRNADRSTASGQHTHDNQTSGGEGKEEETTFSPLRGLPSTFRVHIDRRRILPLSEGDNHSIKVVPCSSNGEEAASLYSCVEELTSTLRQHPEIPIEVTEVNAFAPKTKPSSSASPPISVMVSYLPIIHILLLYLTPSHEKARIASTVDTPVRLKDYVAQWEKSVRSPYTSFQDANHLVHAVCMVYDPTGAAAHREAQVALGADTSPTTQQQEQRRDPSVSLASSATRLNTAARQVEMCLSLIRNVSSKLIVLHYLSQTASAVLLKSIESVELARREWVSMQWERYAARKSKLKRKGVLEREDPLVSSRSSSSSTTATTVTATTTASSRSHLRQSPTERWSLLHYWRLGFDAVLHAIILRRYKDAAHIVHLLNAEFSRHTEDYPTLVSSGSPRDLAVLRYCTEMSSRLMLLEPYLTPAAHEYARDDCVASPLLLCPGESLFPGFLFLSAVELHCIVMVLWDSSVSDAERANNEMMLWKCMRSFHLVMKESGIRSGDVFFLRVVEDFFQLVAVAAPSSSSVSPSENGGGIKIPLRVRREALPAGVVWDAWATDVISMADQPPHLQWRSVRSLLYRPLLSIPITSFTVTAMKLEVLLTARQCVASRLASFCDEAGEAKVTDICERWVGYTLLAAHSLTHLGRHREAFMWYYRLAHVALRQHHLFDSRQKRELLAAKIVFHCVLPSLSCVSNSGGQRVDEELERIARATLIDSVEQHLELSSRSVTHTPSLQPSHVFNTTAWSSVPPEIKECYLECMWWLVTHPTEARSVKNSVVSSSSKVVYAGSQPLSTATTIATTASSSSSIPNKRDHQQWVDAVVSAEWFPGAYRFHCLERVTFQQWMMWEQVTQHLRGNVSTPSRTPSPLAIFIESLRFETSNQGAPYMLMTPVSITMEMVLRGENGKSMWKGLTRSSGHDHHHHSTATMSKVHFDQSSSSVGFRLQFAYVGSLGESSHPPPLCTTSSRSSTLRNILADSDTFSIHIPLNQCTEQDGTLTCNTQAFYPPSIGSYTLLNVQLTLLSNGGGEKEEEEEEEEEKKKHRLASTTYQWSYRPFDEHTGWESNSRDIAFRPLWIFQVRPPPLPLLQMAAHPASAVSKASSPSSIDGFRPRIYLSVVNPLVMDETVVKGSLVLPTPSQQPPSPVDVSVRFPIAQQMVLRNDSSTVTERHRWSSCFWAEAVHSSAKADGEPVRIFFEDHHVGKEMNGEQTAVEGWVYAHSSSSTTSLPRSSPVGLDNITTTNVPLWEPLQSSSCTIVFVSSHLQRQVTVRKEPLLDIGEVVGINNSSSSSTSRDTISSAHIQTAVEVTTSAYRFRVNPTTPSIPYHISIDAPFSILRGGPGYGSEPVEQQPYPEWPHICIQQEKMEVSESLTSFSSSYRCQCTASIPAIRNICDEVRLTSIPFSPAFVVTAVEGSVVQREGGNEELYFTVVLQRPPTAQHAILLEQAPRFDFVSIKDVDKPSSSSCLQCSDTANAPTTTPTSSTAGSSSSSYVLHQLAPSKEEVPWLPGEVRRYVASVNSRALHQQSSAEHSPDDSWRHRSEYAFTLQLPYQYLPLQLDGGSSDVHHVPPSDVTISSSSFPSFLYITSPFHFAVMHELALFDASYSWGEGGEDGGDGEGRMQQCAALPRNQPIPLTVTIRRRFSSYPAGGTQVRFQCMETVGDSSPSAAAWVVVGTSSETVTLSSHSPASLDGSAEQEVVEAVLHFVLLLRMGTTAAGSVTSPSYIPFPVLKATLIEEENVKAGRVSETEAGIHIRSFPPYVTLLQ